MSAGLQFAGHKVSRQEIEVRAKRYVREWRESCFVYERPGYWIMSRGPDLDHPKTDATFIIRYEKPEVKRERV